MTRWHFTIAASLLFASGLAAGNDADTRAARVDGVFAEYAKPDRPGCALGVMREGQLVYSKGYGLANLENSVPIDPLRTAFDIGSMSKQFTAASILLLAHEGKLSLDDDIRKYLPEVPDYGHTITIANLLHHTSGLRDYTGLMSLEGFNGADYTTDDDALEIIGRQKALNFAPGSKFDYSNTGFFLMSLIVKRVSGKPLSQFAQERLFAPLGMHDTLILDTYNRVVPHRATGYEPADANGYVVDMSNWQQTGDGAVQTTIADLARWDRQFYQPTVGGDWLDGQMQTVGTLADGSKIDYASGLFIGKYRGLKTVSHGGAWAGYRAELLRFPEQRMSFAVLCNRGDSDPTSLAHSVADAYLGEGMTASPSAAPSTVTPAQAAKLGDPQRWTGRYFNADSDLVRSIEWKDGKLWYVRDSSSRTELVAVDSSHLRMIGVPGTYDVTMTAAERGARKLVLVKGDDPEPFALDEVATFEPTPAQLADFAGTYVSDELKLRVTLWVVDGKLMSKIPRQPAQPLEPAFPGTFTAGPMLLHFERDGSGHVTGFGLDASRMKKIVFVRRQTEKGDVAFAVTAIELAG